MVPFVKKPADRRYRMRGLQPQIPGLTSRWTGDLVTTIKAGRPRRGRACALVGEGNAPFVKIMLVSRRLVARRSRASA